MEIWVHSLLTEDISKTEDSLYISAGGVFCSVERGARFCFLGDVEEGLRTLQRLRVDVTSFVGGGICSTEKKSQILGV